MEGANNLKLKLQADAVADLWQQQCSLHTSLFELTCDEYIHLLASDMDKLDQTIEDKQTLIQDINNLEDKRQLYLQEINEDHIDAGIQKLSELTSFLSLHGLDKESQRLQKLNLVLMDIVDKIQEQNKRNQVFLNKALLSLKELKKSFGGGSKRYETYGSNGATRNSLGR